MKVIVLVASLLLATADAGSDKLTPVDEAGLRRLLADNKGNVVLLGFWATWCEPCRAEMPQLVDLQSRLKGRGFRLLLVSADEPEQEAEALRFLQGQRAPLPAYIKRAADDQQFIDSIDPKWSGALPALFLYERSGRQVTTWIGEADFETVRSRVMSYVGRR